MATNIGSILAQSGATTGQLMGGGIANLGAGLSSGIGGMLTNRRKAEEEAEAQQLLQQYSNDPAQLRAMSQKYAVGGQPEVAKVFEDAATRAITKESTNSQRGVQGGLMAITQAASRGTPLADLKEAQSSVVAQGGTNEQIMKAYKGGVELAKGQKNKTLQGSPGTVFGSYDDSGKFVVDYTVPFKPETEGKTEDKVFELLKGGKHTPASIQDSVGPNGEIDASLLIPVTKEKTRGNVSAGAEKRNNAISEESTKASVSLSRNRALQVSLQSGENKSTGIISDLRTSALNLAGLRDAEEEDKTAFLRNRNTDIVNGLPPGVASDRDIDLFSQGFPEGNAGTAEILRYLQAEERILAASADMALVADNHLQRQIDDGLDATMVGFEAKKQQYGVIMQQMRTRIEKRTAAATTEDEKIAIEQEEIKMASEILGFVPKFFR